MQVRFIHDISFYYIHMLMCMAADTISEQMYNVFQTMDIIYKVDFYASQI